MTARLPQTAALSRRALLGAGLASVLCACGAPATESGPTQIPTPSQTPGRSNPSEPSASRSTRFSRDDAIAKYGSVAPKEWGLTLTGMALTLGAKAVQNKAIALTFDACGGPTPTSTGCGYDKALIDFLRSRNARATLFLNSRWIAANPKVAAELAADPLFEIGNHGMRHLPLSVSGKTAYGEQGTHNIGEAYDEIAGNVETLTKLTGKAPRWFRSGTAHCDDVAVRMVADLGQRVVNFAVNGDFGTTATPAQVVTQLATVKAGDIVISHMNHPEHQTAAGYQAGLDAVLAKGLRTATLSEYLA